MWFAWCYGHTAKRCRQALCTCMRIITYFADLREQVHIIWIMNKQDPGNHYLQWNWGLSYFQIPDPFPIPTFRERTKVNLSQRKLADDDWKYSLCFEYSFVPMSNSQQWRIAWLLPHLLSTSMPFSKNQWVNTSYISTLVMFLYKIGLLDTISLYPLPTTMPVFWFQNMTRKLTKGMWQV